MQEQSFKAGDKVVMKTNWNVVYLYLSDDGKTATVLDNLSEINIPLIVLEKYDAVRRFGL